MRRCVWSRNLKNAEAMARVGPQHQKGGGIYLPSLREIFLGKSQVPTYLPQAESPGTLWIPGRRWPRSFTMIRVGVLRGGLGRSGYHLGTSQLPSRFALNSRSNCKITDFRVRDKGVCGLLGYDNINSLYNLKMEAVCFIETLTTTYQTIWHNTKIQKLKFLLPCKPQISHTVAKTKRSGPRYICKFMVGVKCVLL